MELDKLFRPLEALTVVRWGQGTAVAFAERLLSALGALVYRWPDQDEPVANFREPDWIRWPGSRTPLFASAAEVGSSAIVLAHQPVPPSHLLARCPQVVLTSFGVEGPAARWAGDDLVIQALGGLCGLIGDPRRAPLYIPYEFANLQLGLHGAAAVLAVAVSRPSASPTPHVVDISGADVLASYTRMYSMLYRQYGIRPHRSGRRAPGSGTRYPFGIFPCQDGYVVLIGRYPDDWNRYLTMMGHPEWFRAFADLDEFLLATEYADALDSHIIPWLKQFTREELAELGRQYELPIAPVRSPAEVLQDVQMRFRDFFVQQGAKTLPGLPARIVVPTSSSLCGDRLKRSMP